MTVKNTGRRSRLIGEHEDDNGPANLLLVETVLFRMLESMTSGFVGTSMLSQKTTSRPPRISFRPGEVTRATCSRDTDQSMNTRSIGGWAVASQTSSRNHLN